MAGVVPTYPQRRLAGQTSHLRLPPSRVNGRRQIRPSALQLRARRNVLRARQHLELTRVASAGISYNRFHTTAICWPLERHCSRGGAIINGSATGQSVEQNAQMSGVRDGAVVNYPPYLFLGSFAVLWIAAHAGALLRRYWPLKGDERDDFVATDFSGSICTCAETTSRRPRHRSGT